ncbi:MAG: hypothetical protein KJ968_04235, partial [Nanoarchaeota archaeon]|nr:hypothetical protein [Nanoarchaeota archaeon]
NPSVKQKVAGIKAKIAEVNAGAKKIEAGIREQERVNATAVAKQQTNIKAQATENKDYVKDFYFGEGKEK